ncbi:MAG: TRAP transporter substrate-binding protein DctP [Pseudomonadota bacterium]
MSIFRRTTIAIAGLVLLLMGSASSAATLKLATLSPDGSGWMKVLRKHGANIEQRTDGNVKVKFYPGGVMGDDKAVLRKMRVGQLHGAVVTSGGLMQAYPDIVLYSLPLMFRNEAEVDAVREAMDDRLMQGLSENKFVGFGFAEVGFAYPMTQANATSVEQMRSLKVWTPDNDPGALAAFDAFNITPIPLPMADVLTGLQTGLIDSIASPPIATIALQWHTQVEYGLELPLLYVYGTLALTERAFKRLSAEEQAIVREELEAAVAEADSTARRDHVSAKAALSGQGVVWQKPETDSMNRWDTLAEDARARLIANNYVTPEVYAEVEALLQKLRE